MFGGLGVGELLLLFLVLLLLFGAKRIPEIARGVGQGIRNFKSDVQDPDRLSDGDDGSGDGGRRDDEDSDRV